MAVRWVKKNSQATKKALGWPTMDKFYLPTEAVDYFRQAVPEGEETRRAVEGSAFAAYRKEFPNEAAEFEQILSGRFRKTGAADLPQVNPTDKPIATRAAGGAALNALAKNIPNILGGSADLNPSTDTALKGLGDFQPPESGGAGTLGAVGGEWSYAGRNIAFGVREHAMGAAVNGMAAHGGVLPFSATFFNFSDYMKPAMRLGALSRLKVVYVFTHDSIGLGEDGPTHEPVEQLAGLRAMPDLTVIRPADPNETAEAWAFAVQHDGANHAGADAAGGTASGSQPRQSAWRCARRLYPVGRRGRLSGRDPDRDRLGSRLVREGARGAEEAGRQSPRCQHAELGLVRRARPAVPGQRIAETDQEARRSGGRFAARLAALDRRRRRHHRRRAFRCIRAR